MHKPNVLIVGNSGTVGLDLINRLSTMSGAIVVSGLSRSHTPSERHALLQAADIAVLCLPESAAVAFVQEASAYPSLRILDASPAHRTNAGWTYGLPDLSRTQEESIRTARYVANPGCYATGAILLLRPLMQALAQKGVTDQPNVAITAIGGVSSGGNKMMAQAQASPFGYRLFGLTQEHRHIPEIQTFAGLNEEPIFMPAVAAHQRGTMVQIPFTTKQLGLSVDDTIAALQRAYAGTSVAVHAYTDDRFLDGGELASQDGVRIDVLVDADKRRMVLVARFDNLGKGAAGAAVHNLRLMLSRP